RDLHDAVAETDAVGALGAGGEEHLGRRGVAVLLEEVVLDLPDAVHAELVGQLHLLEGVLDELVLGVGLPGAGELMLVEHAELHGGSLLWKGVDGVVEETEEGGAAARFSGGEGQAAA